MVVKRSHQITQVLDSTGLSELEFSNIFKYSFQKCSKIYLVGKHLLDRQNDEEVMILMRKEKCPYVVFTRMV